MSFLLWNIKYVYLPTIFEVVSFSRVIFAHKKGTG